jgi:hypothetical protein
LGYNNKYNQLFTEYLKTLLKLRLTTIAELSASGLKVHAKGTREVATINRHAVELNSEMSDALSFQVNSADE